MQNIDFVTKFKLFWTNEKCLEANILLGNGSQNAITAHVYLAIFSQGHTAVSPLDNEDMEIMRLPVAL